MFRKLAQVRSFGTALWQAGDGGLVKTAQQAGGERSEPSEPSYYLDGARVLDIEGMLGRYASEYALSEDPSDYFFEAIRANTTAVPNENHDAFPRHELLSFNTRLSLPVYMTYKGKPHHLNHRTENPKMARGFILDAHYVDDTPALDSCPRCESKTAAREERDPSGIFCRHCGYVVKDESVETLVAVDKTKDPAFTKGVLDRILVASSMGCNCVSTSCNTCKHVAYAANEFCEHIQPGNKGKLWIRQGTDWRRI